MSKAFDSAKELEYISYDSTNNRINFGVSISSNNSAIGGQDDWVRTQANAAFIKANTAISYGSNTANTSFVAIPIGNTAQRPSNAANGALRFNTTLNQLETYMPTGGWVGLIKDQYAAEVLVVAGGGGGGAGSPGYNAGGGAGGLIYQASVSFIPGTSYGITIGAGGVAGANGSNTIFASGQPQQQIAFGGGSGAGSLNSPVASQGGSGGGGGYGPTISAKTNGANSFVTSPSQGYPGGAGYNWSSGAGTGGGGGAGAPGQDASTNYNVAPSKGGNGGDGLSYFGSYWAGGGGGGAQSAPAGLGGAGGGGNGQSPLGPTTGSAGTTNTGGGGGGGGNVAGLAGGSGVVVIRYLGVQRGTGGNVSYDGTYTKHTFTGTGSFVA